MKKTLTIFGTLEIGSSQMRDGKDSKFCLGGNGLLAALAASKIGKVYLMGLIGSDIDKENFVKKLPKSINTENLEQYIGKTFRYKAIYDKKNNLVDEIISFGVYENYQPKVILEKIKHTDYIFFSGTNPRYCLAVLEQLDGKQIVGFNTLYYHLQNNFQYVRKLLRFTTILFTNKKEYTFLQKKLGNLFSVLKKLDYIFITNGTEGIELLTRKQSYAFPITYPVLPLDPTNAGDVFSATVMALLSKAYSLEEQLEEIVQKAQIEASNVILNKTFYRIPTQELIYKNILDEIVANKKNEINQKSRKKLIRRTPLRNFSDAIFRPGQLTIIGEIKKASPSEGVLKEQFYPLQIAKQYQASHAVRAVSVLTDNIYFQGKLELIKQVKNVTSMPVLRKDFIFDEKQVYESFAAEADALLLIAKILTPRKLKKLLQLTEKLGMQALVEVHVCEEVQQALQAGAKIIGINARNLDDFTIDKNLLAELIKNIPQDIAVVAESGIETPHDLKSLKMQGASSALIGTAFMKADNLSKELEQFKEVI